ncbi:MAG: PAS domain-containing protein [Planctomycetota bacterium]
MTTGGRATSAAAQRLSAPQNPTQPFPTKPMHALLIVEPSFPKSIICAALAARGYLIDECCDAEAALRLLAEPTQFVFVDRLLAGGVGLELCRRIRKTRGGQRAVLVVLTVSDEPQQLVDLLRSGADESLVLPLDAELLEARLSRLERWVHSNESNGATNDRTAHTRSPAAAALLLDASPVLLWGAEADGAWTQCGVALLNFAGRSAEQMQGMGWAESLHPDDYSRTLDRYHAAIQDSKELAFEFRLRRADGCYRWLSATMLPRRSPRGATIGFFGACHDVTDRKHLIATLEELGASTDARFARIDEIAHELTNTLQSLLANVHLVRVQLSAGASALENLEQLERAVCSAAELTRALSGGGASFAAKNDYGQPGTGNGAAGAGPEPNR